MNILCKVACTLFLLSFTFQTATAQKSISKKDKQAIIDIFEGVDESKFIMYFNDGKEVYGKKRIKMSDLKMDEKWIQSAGKSVKWTFIVGDRSANEVIYVYTEGMSAMASLLGKRKLQQLISLTEKYEDIEPSGRRR